MTKYWNVFFLYNFFAVLIVENHLEKAVFSGMNGWVTEGFDVTEATL